MRVRSLVFILLVVSLMVLLVAGCSRNATPPADTSTDQVSPPVSGVSVTDPVDGDNSNIVAFVNSVPVSRDDFERGKAQLLSRYQPIYTQIGLDINAELEGAQGRLLELRIEDEALELAIARALISAELDRRGSPVPEADVEAVFESQHTQFLTALGMSAEELEETFATGELAGVKTGDLTFTQFITSTKRTIREELESQTAQRLIAGTIDPSEETLIAFFEQHRVDYDLEKQVRVSHILVATEELARQGLAVLDAGVTFFDLADEISLDDATSKRGGDLGWFERGRLAAPFEYAAFALPVGEVSGIIRSEYGYHILLVTDLQEAKKSNYEDVADLVARDFKASTVEQRFEDWFTASRSAAVVSIQDRLLEAYLEQQEDIEQGLQAYLRLQDEGLVNEPYLGYIIGTIYETKMDEAQSKKLGIQARQSITPSEQEQIDTLEAEIETSRSQALASYRASLALLGEDAEIEARIQFLESDL